MKTNGQFRYSCADSFSSFLPKYECPIPFGRSKGPQNDCEMSGTVQIGLTSDFLSHVISLHFGDGPA
jgi:hypothetical protein